MIGSNRLKQKATALVAQAIKAGLLPKLDGTIKCIDCKKAAWYYDHRKYREPLKVVPVCPSCNCKRGHADDYNAPETSNKIEPRILIRSRGKNFKPPPKYLCSKCWYVWNPRLNRKPSVCPRCKRTTVVDLIL